MHREKKWRDCREQTASASKVCLKLGTDVNAGMYEFTAKGNRWIEKDSSRVRKRGSENVSNSSEHSTHVASYTTLTR